MLNFSIMALQHPIELIYSLEGVYTDRECLCVCVSASSPVVSAGCGDYLRKCRGVAVMKRPPRKRTDTHTHTYTHQAQ